MEEAKNITSELKPAKIILAGHFNRAVPLRPMRALARAYPAAQWIYVDSPEGRPQSGMTQAVLQVSEELCRNDLLVPIPFRPLMPTACAMEMMALLNRGDVVVVAYDGRKKGSTADLVERAVRAQIPVIRVEGS